MKDMRYLIETVDSAERATVSTDSKKLDEVGPLLPIAGGAIAAGARALAPRISNILKGIRGTKPADAAKAEPYIGAAPKPAATPTPPAAAPSSATTAPSAPAPVRPTQATDPSKNLTVDVPAGKGPGPITSPSPTRLDTTGTTVPVSRPEITQGARGGSMATGQVAPTTTSAGLPRSQPATPPAAAPSSGTTAPSAPASARTTQATDPSKNLTVDVPAGKGPGPITSPSPTRLDTTGTTVPVSRPEITQGARGGSMATGQVAPTTTSAGLPRSQPATPPVTPPATLPATPPATLPATSSASAGRILAPAAAATALAAAGTAGFMAGKSGKAQSDPAKPATSSSTDNVAPNGVDSGSSEAPRSKEDYGNSDPSQTPPTPSNYTIRKGDTLSDIAQRNNTSVRELLRLNKDITNPDVLKTGQQITVSGSPESTYAGGVGSASDTTAKIKSGEYSDSPISQAAMRTSPSKSSGENTSPITPRYSPDKYTITQAMQNAEKLSDMYGRGLENTFNTDELPRYSEKKLDDRVLKESQMKEKNDLTDILRLSGLMKVYEQSSYFPPAGSVPPPADPTYKPDPKTGELKPDIDYKLRPDLKPAPSTTQPPAPSTPPKSVKEADMEEGNAFGDAVRKAKEDGIQKGETVKVGGKTYPVKEDQLDECGEMGPMANGMDQQEGRMSVNMNTSTDGNRSITITADGDKADELASLLRLSGLEMHDNEDQQAEPVITIGEDKDKRYEASTTPDEHVMSTDVQLKGGDGEVAGEEKTMVDGGSARFSDNPKSVKKESKQSSVALSFLKEYESIVQKKKLDESETPQAQDLIGFEFGDFLLETTIHSVTDDTIVVESDDYTIKYLTRLGYLGEDLDPAELTKSGDRLDQAAEEDPTEKAKQEETEKTIQEAEYHGRKVPLGKPMRGDVKKSKVYIRKPNGNIVKVNFGDPNMKIKKSNPKRRKSFRARHHCENPGPRWRARYWSCRAW